MKFRVKKVFALICTVCVLLAMSVPAFAAGGVTATPTSATVLVNGKNVGFQAYNIGGNNYFKLRDIAKAISGSDKQFEVGVNGTNIILTSEKTYTPVGGELVSSGSTTSVSATLSIWKVYLDERVVNLTAYYIGGNNYFKLRDVAKAINFEVGYNTSLNTITINTTAEYTSDKIDTALVGVWTYNSANESVIYEFYKNGNFIIYYCTDEGTNPYSGVYTVNGSKITNVYDDGVTTKTISYEIKTINGKSALLLTGDAIVGSATLYREADDSIVGAWATGYGDDLLLYFLYSDGSAEIGLLDLSNNYTRLYFGTYSVSGSTLTIVTPEETLTNSFKLVFYEGTLLMIMTDSEGTTTFGKM